MTNDESATAPLTAEADPRLPSDAELAATVSARLCHDFISPASAIVSGLDLLEDPESQDMREDAMSLITASARKLADHLAFARVAFGASAAADTFDIRALKALAEGVYAHVRADLAWDTALDSVNKPAARALLNLAQIGAGAMPTGGLATITADRDGDFLTVGVRAESPKVRLRAEVAEGLSGQPLGEGLAGHWVQAYYLFRLVKEAGGSLSFEADETRMTAKARVPA
ncbi:MAG TPA: histidine phosphotransferase family protein [Caulobacteraceae bacterium]|nr:histidine phosphotransferase family protein [Caulobacteraceae bacterium]